MIAFWSSTTTLRIWGGPPLPCGCNLVVTWFTLVPAAGRNFSFELWFRFFDVLRSISDELLRKHTFLFQTTVPSRENGFSRKWVFSSKWDNFSNFLHKLKVREMGLSENGSFGRPRRKWDFDQLERKFCNLWKQGFVTLEKKMGFVTLKTYTSSFV